MEVIPESQISFFLSVKLLIAPLEVCIYFHDLRRDSQSNLALGASFRLLGFFKRTKVPSLILVGSCLLNLGGVFNLIM